MLVDDYTIPTDKNGFSAGPIDFQGTVTVPTGSAYYVVDEELTPVSYTITEVDDLMLNKQDTGVSYTKTETDSLLDNVVDSADVYTKTETDSLVNNKADVSTVNDVTSRLTSTENDIVELEEEIEALAPSFDRGHWIHDPITGASGAAPGQGAYYIVDDNATVTQEFNDTRQIYFNNIDDDTPAKTHTFNDVNEGMYMELFEGLDSSFLFGQVETVTKQSDHTVINLTVIKAEGGPGLDTDSIVSDVSLREGIRVKFFNLSEGDIDLDGYMQTSGGVFTGLVKHKKEIVMEPSLPSRFVNIKNRYATDADGNNSGGSDNQNFGVNFDLDHGNSGYNTVKWSNRNGNIFAVYGGTQANAKYTGAITENKHLVNKAYVDNQIAAIPAPTESPTLYTLQTSGNSYTFSNGLDAPSDTSFRTASTSLQYNKEFHFKKLYDHNGGNAFLKDYQATPSTMLEIYNRGVLLLKTTIKNYRTSDRSATSVMFNVSGMAASVHNYSSLVNNSTYQVVLTNMEKK